MIPASFGHASDVSAKSRLRLTFAPTGPHAGDDPLRPGAIPMRAYDATVAF